VFNLLTSAIKGFDAQIPAKELSSIVVMMKPSLTVFISELQNNTIRWADKSSEAGGSAFLDMDFTRLQVVLQFFGA
jgi:hypothetical protein